MAAPQQRGLRRRIADWFINNAGWIRFTIWLAFVLIVIWLDIYLYIHYPKIVGPEVFTGVLIAVVTIAPFLYRRIVDAPILRIEIPEEDVVRKPILVTLNLPQACKCSAQQQQSQQMLWCLCQCPTPQQPAIVCYCPHQLIIQQPQQQAQQPPQQQVQQQQASQEVGYLRLRVRNTGLAAAEKCVFQVRIARWPSNCSANCHAPSDEYVDWHDVTWAGWEQNILIRPNDVRYANIAIMPLDANKQACLNAPWQCDNKVNPCGPLIAWIAKRETFMQGCRSQDGLVAGEYVIDVQVTCRNGRKKPERLRLRIFQDWNNTDIMMAC